MKELKGMMEEGLIHWAFMIVVAVFMTLLIFTLYVLRGIDIVLRTLDREISKGVERLFHRSTPEGFLHLVLGGATILVSVVLLLGFSFTPYYSGLVIVAGLLIGLRGYSLLFAAPVST